MATFIDLLIQQLLATSLAEWVAVTLAMAYVILAVKESLWCWPAAFISTAIYTILFFDVSLYMESALNVYYLLMAIYGWFKWCEIKPEETIRPIVKWSIRTHAIVITSLLVLVVVSGYLLEQYTDQDFAYIDSLTTWFAVLTTYMVAQKVLENWLYWIAIDAVSIYLYIQKDFILTAILFSCYLVIAYFGWVRWRAHFYSQESRAINDEMRAESIAHEQS